MMSSTNLVSIASGVDLAVTTFTPVGAPSERDIVLTHGLASNQQLWFGAAEALAANGHRVFTFDQRGHGQSSKPDQGYDMASVADDVAWLLDTLGLDTPVVGGQSWGGNVMLEVAHRHGPAIGGAVLVDGGFLHLKRDYPTWEDCADSLAPPALLGMARTEIERWVETMAADWPEQGRQATLANFETRSDGTIAPWLTFERHMTVLRGLWNHEPPSIYADIHVPVMIVAAADSDSGRARKQGAVDDAVAMLPHASAHWHEPAHHDVHAQQPEAVAERIQAFTRSLSS